MVINDKKIKWHKFQIQNNDKAGEAYCGLPEPAASNIQPQLFELNIQSLKALHSRIFRNSYFWDCAHK